MTEEQVEIARRAYADFNRGGVERILEHLDPAIEWRPWGRFARQPRVMRGHDGVRELFSVYDENIDGLQVEPLEFIDKGDRLVVPIRFFGQAKGADEKIRVELVHVWEMEGTKATRVEVFESKDEALRSLED